jgi:hypothetical protein
LLKVALVTLVSVPLIDTLSSDVAGVGCCTSPPRSLTGPCGKHPHAPLVDHI